MNRSAIVSEDRAAMLARLDQITMRPEDRARAATAMLRAEALVDLYCNAHAFVADCALAMTRAWRHAGERARPGSREPLLDRK